MMMWMWISSIVILFGAELNAEIEHQTARDSTVHGEKPLGARGAAMADAVGAGGDGTNREKYSGDYRFLREDNSLCWKHAYTAASWFGHWSTRNRKARLHNRALDRRCRS